jgi:hypothetical protein
MDGIPARAFVRSLYCSFLALLMSLQGLQQQSVTSVTLLHYTYSKNDILCVDLPKYTKVVLTY